MSHFMNPARERHITGGGGSKEGSKDVDEKSGQHHAPSIHIHSHSKGMTVHTMHSNGKHSKAEFKKDDAGGVADHVHAELGGEPTETSRDMGGSEGPEAGSIPGLD